MNSDYSDILCEEAYMENIKCVEDEEFYEESYWEECEKSLNN